MVGTRAATNGLVPATGICRFGESCKDYTIGGVSRSIPFVAIQAIARFIPVFDKCYHIPGLGGTFRELGAISANSQPVLYLYQWYPYLTTTLIACYCLVEHG